MQKGSKADGTLGYMTEEQYEQLVNSDFVEQAGHRRIIGYASNTSSHSIEINYADSVQQELTFCVPTHGAAPEKANEIATTDLALIFFLSTTTDFHNRLYSPLHQTVQSTIMDYTIHCRRL